MKFFDWMYRLVKRFMGRQRPRETEGAETAEVLRKKKFYEDAARRGGR